jgi:hypothetical protein
MLISHIHICPQGRNACRLKDAARVDNDQSATNLDEKQQHQKTIDLLQIYSHEGARDPNPFQTIPSTDGFAEAFAASENHPLTPSSHDLWHTCIHIALLGMSLIAGDPLDGYTEYRARFSLQLLSHHRKRI